MNDVEQEKTNTSRNDDFSQIDVNMFNDFICNTLKGYVDWKVAYSYVTESFFLHGWLYPACDVYKNWRRNMLHSNFDGFKSEEERLNNEELFVSLKDPKTIYDKKTCLSTIEYKYRKDNEVYNKQHFN